MREVCWFVAYKGFPASVITDPDAIMAWFSRLPLTVQARVEIWEVQPDGKAVKLGGTPAR